MATDLPGAYIQTVAMNGDPTCTIVMHISPPCGALFTFIA